MSFAPYASERDKLDRYINGFATQSFRDQADRDYVHARSACRNELFPQFLWSAQQAVEKYLKAILLYNRIKATTVGHDIQKALDLTQSLPFVIRLSTRSRSFLEHLCTYGQFRYIDVPFHVYGKVLVDLDLTVWEVRRYCQVLNVFGKSLPEREHVQLEQAWTALERSEDEPKHRFKLHGGWLESVMDQKKHPSREALLWQNACYGNRSRRTVMVKSHLHAQNPLLYLYPEMLDELQRYVFIPPKLEKAYRLHLSEIQSGTIERP